MSAEPQNWLLGPDRRTVDGPQITENIAVVPEFKLDQAEEALREIARGRLDDPIQFARDYFGERTVVVERTL